MSSYNPIVKHEYNLFRSKDILYFYMSFVLNRIIKTSFLSKSTDHRNLTHFKGIIQIVGYAVVKIEPL